MGVCVLSSILRGSSVRPSRRFGIRKSRSPRAAPKDLVIIYSCGSTWGDLFRAPPFLPERSVCNSKSLLRAPRFCVRARLDTLRFRSGELGSDFVVPWSFSDLLGSFPVKIPRGIVYGLSRAGFWATWAVGPPHQRARL